MMAPSLEMGSEGQALFLMRPEDFLTANDAIPHFQEILRRFIGITAPAGT